MAASGSLQLLDNKCFKAYNNNLVVGKCDGSNDKKLIFQTNMLDISVGDIQLFVVDNNINTVDANNTLKCLHYDIKQNNVTVGDCISGKKVIDSLKKNNIETNYQNWHDPTKNMSTISSFIETHYSEFWVLDHLPEQRKNPISELISKIRGHPNI